MPKNHLVVLSLPFQRLIRSHYTPWLMDALTESADVVVVSPFAEEPSFRSAIPNPRVRHLPSPPPPERLPWLYRKLVTISSIMRMQGYWRRHRDYLTYYWENRHLGFGENGCDTFAPLHKRVVMDALAWIGAWPQAWRWIDRLIGRRSYDLPELAQLAQAYRRVTLIQASSWGFQDQALAWMARTNRWRSILLPYTTDQLCTNGFLYCDYDAVCVQGPTEKRFAVELHAVEPHRIVEFGSLNFYSMRRVLKSTPDVRPAEASRKRILVIGVSATYFPSESEFSMLDNVLEAIDQGVLGNVSVTYRPIPQSPQIEEAIKERFPEGNGRLTIEYAPSAALGLARLSCPDAVSLAVNHVNALSGYSVAVMAGCTSLALDLSCMGTPSIACVADATGTLERRKTNMMLGRDGAIDGLESIPVAMDTPSLLSLLKRFLDDRTESERVATKICDAWDYPSSDVEQRLRSLLA